MAFIIRIYHDALSSEWQTEFAVFVCLFIYLPDFDLVQVETCRRRM